MGEVENLSGLLLKVYLFWTPSIRVDVILNLLKADAFIYDWIKDLYFDTDVLKF